MRLSDTAATLVATDLDWRDRVGVYGLYLFAFAALLSKHGAHLGIVLMLFGVVTRWRGFGRALYREKLAWAWAAVVLTLVLSTASALLARPEWAERQYDAAIDIVVLWGFLLVAWNLHGDQRRLLWTLALALLGFVCGRLRGLDDETLTALASWQRPGFGLPVIAFGQYSASALLGLILLAPRGWRALCRCAAGWRWSLVLLWGLLTLLALQGVLISGSRGVWLALAAVVLLLFAKKPPPGYGRSAALPGKPVLALLLLIALLLNSPIIVQRLSFGSEFFDLLWSGRFEHIEDIAVQARLIMLESGLSWWWQRPWLGWGPGATPHLLRDSGNPLIASLGSSDLHNIVVDLLVRLGVFGFAALLASVAIIFRLLRRACRHGHLDRDLYLLLLALLLLHFFCALTNFRVLNSDWRFFWMLIAGAACAFSLRQPPLASRP